MLWNSVNEHVVNRVEVETSRIIKKINQEKINHKTKHINISQNQHTDKVVDGTVVIQKQVSHQNQKTHRKRRRKRLNKMDLRLNTSDYSEHACRRSVQDIGN